jgi:hypothetical protein
MRVLALLEPSSPRLQDYSNDRVPALGSVLVCNLEADIVALAEAYSCHSRWPWCPILVVVPPRLGLDVRVLEAFEPRSGAVVPFLSEWASVESDLRSLKDAVRDRARPSGWMLAKYVRRRTRRKSIDRALDMCLAAGLSPRENGLMSHRSTLGRHLKDFGPLKPHDWLAVGHLVHTHLAATSSGCRTVEAAALRVGVDPRTLRRRLLRYCGCDYMQSRMRLGWEWLLESVLRRFGYVQTWAVPRRLPSLGSELTRSFSVMRL